MLKTSGHVKQYYIQCCNLYQEFKDRNGNQANLQSFINMIESFSNNINNEDDKLKFKGDMLEIFAELFFMAFKNDPRVGLVEYTPIPIDEDYGVDGKGINASGNECAVQVKYRSNPQNKVTYEEISKTFTSAKLQFNMPLDSDDCIYVFTTAYEVTPQCARVLGRKLRVISKDIIVNEVDNNINFWNMAYNEIKETLIKVM